MTNQELWPIGTHVTFEVDATKFSGAIILHCRETVLICLDACCSDYGWRIHPTEENEQGERVPEKYVNKRGWEAKYSDLRRTKTKKGNEL